MTVQDTRRRTRIASVTATAVAAVLIAACGPTAAFAADASTELGYDTPGTYEYVVPTGSPTYRLAVSAAGAAGGSTCVAGGFGTEVSGWIGVRAGDKIKISVGGHGQTVTSSTANQTAAGGFNGGGDAGAGVPGARIAGGGGSTNLTVVPTAGVPVESFIAGGGGGAGACVDATGGVGGSDSDGEPGQHVRVPGEGWLKGGAGGIQGISATPRGLNATKGGGGGGGGHLGGGAGAGGHMYGWSAGSGGGGAGTSAFAPRVVDPTINGAVAAGDGRVNLVLTPISNETKTDVISLGNLTSEGEHGMVQFPATSVGGIGKEAGVDRRFTGKGSADYNFRYDSGLTPDGKISVTITETYPAGAASKRAYGVYINNQLVHTRSNTANEGIKTYSFTVDGAQFAADKTLKVMIKNSNATNDASIHQIELTTGN